LCVVLLYLQYDLNTIGGYIYVRINMHMKVKIPCIVNQMIGNFCFMLHRSYSVDLVATEDTPYYLGCFVPPFMLGAM
jgi:hypothetical protein